MLLYAVVCSLQMSSDYTKFCNDDGEHCDDNDDNVRVGNMFCYIVYCYIPYVIVIQ